MSNQFEKNALKQSRSSKIQVEVKEFAPQQMNKNTTTQLNSDADGGDLSNE